jgi:hypothetical protein
MEYKIYVLTYESDIMYLDDEDCANFFVDVLDNEYFKFELPLTSNSPISSDEIYNLEDFIKYLEVEYSFYLDPKNLNENYDYEEISDGYKRLKSKLREQKINKILND